VFSADRRGAVSIGITGIFILGPSPGAGVDKHNCYSYNDSYTYLGKKFIGALCREGSKL
jgi:hypothetical protein